MTGPASLRGWGVVAQHEFLVNLRSVRLLIMLAVLALVVVGGAYGFTAGPGAGGPSLSPLVAWGHPSIAPTGEHLAVVWVSAPFGAPLADRSVTFLVGPQGQEEILGEVRTDADGFARLAVGNRTEVVVIARSGVAEYGLGIFFFEPPVNFTTAYRQDDLDNDGLFDDLGIHVVTRDGAPATAQIYLNESIVTSANSRGYGRVELPQGQSNVTVEVAGERETIPQYVGPAFQPPFATGPDFVLLIIAGGFAAFAVPIFAIVISFDALSKERVQGTLDLLLSRPVGRAGALLGKFGGSFAAVAVPVTLVNVAGLAILTATSGKAPTASFAVAFLGLELLLIAFYVPLQLIFSTLAKTSGTAILFGFLVFLAFNVLYSVITSVLSLVLFPNNFEAQFRFLQVAGLGNPTSIYQQLVAFAAPATIGSGFGPFGGTTLDLPIVALAALVWLAGLLGLALWTFHRRAAE